MTRTFRYLAATTLLALSGRVGAQRLVAPEHWVLSARPVVDIGGGVDPSGEFSKVSLLRWDRQNDVLVVDGSAVDIRVFDASGRFIRRIGREGSGPGDFRRISSIGVFGGDTLAIHDGFLNRLNLVSVQGRFLTTIPFEGVGAFRTPQFVGRLSDGSFIGLASRALGSSPTGRRSYIDEYYRVARTGKVTGIFCEGPGSEGYWKAGADGGVYQLVAPFAPSSFRALIGDTLLAGNGLTGRVAACTPAGRGRETDTGLSPHPLTATEIAQYKMAHTATEPSEAKKAQWLASFAETPLPAKLPLFDRMLTDGANRVWLEEYWFTGSGDRNWLVVDRAGRTVATLRVPAALRLYEVRGDLLLGVLTDRADVEHVVIYRLGKS